MKVKISRTQNKSLFPAILIGAVMENVLLRHENFHVFFCLGKPLGQKFSDL